VVMGPGVPSGSNGYGDPWTTSTTGGSSFGKHLIQAPITRGTTPLTFPQSVSVQNVGFASDHTILTDLRVFEDTRQANVARLDGIQKPRVGNVIEADTLFSWPGIPGLNGLDNVTPVIGSGTGDCSVFPLGGQGLDVHVQWSGRGIGASYSPILPPQAWSASAAQPMFEEGPFQDWNLRLTDAQDGAQADVTLRWKLHYRYENFRHQAIWRAEKRTGSVIASQFMGGAFDGPISVTLTEETEIIDRSTWQFAAGGAVSVDFKIFHLDGDIRSELGNEHVIRNSAILGSTASFGYDPAQGPGIYEAFYCLSQLFEGGQSDEWLLDGRVLKDVPSIFHDARSSTFVLMCKRRDDQ